MPLGLMPRYGLPPTERRSGNGHRTAACAGGVDGNAAGVNGNQALDGGIIGSRRGRAGPGRRVAA